MKNFILCIIVMFISVSVSAMEYEGEFNPKDFLGWRVVENQQIAEDKLMLVVVNPDINHEVKVIALFFRRVGNKGILVGYAYRKHNINYIFALRQGVYRQIKPITAGGDNREYQKTTETST